MSTSTAADLEFEDGTPVRFLLTAAPDQGPAGPDDDLPEGMGRAVPVGRGGGFAADVAVGALRRALRPLGPLLQEVHDAVVAAPRPPSDISVTFGVQVGQDLRLGIVGGNGQAHLTVTASWQPVAGADGGAAPGTG
ncbi:CU044_2847 family protein [Streptomyces sp. BV286]|uniref:CU044_2847 family protein n=1 Tax=unclassified Streptomyces TaxID=2593676 RepID=UPI0027E4B233|nr:CU044_2847 family protein [Streptomyces sp. BV286]